MVISDTSCMNNGLPLLYWCRNLGKSGQGSLDNIVGLGNGNAFEIAYHFGRDCMTAQLCSCLT